MERKFQCPSCGGANKVTNPGILMKICDYCKTAIYWDKESALRAGNKSMDLPQSARFKVGATGKIRGRSFTVLGRLTYAHDQGVWHEWFVEMQDGQIMWLTEDEGELFLETPLELVTPAPPFEELQPGMQITLNDKVGVVEEIGKAQCLGGEGQIPFQVEIGETYPYADGAGGDGSFSFGLEYDAQTGKPSAFIGKILDIKESKVRPEDREGPAERTGEIIRCTSCGKPYEGPRAESTKMVVCAACGSALQLDEAQLRVVGKNPGKKPGFSLNVGTPVTLEGIKYEVMGRLYYAEVEEGLEYGSFEYVLYNAQQGYLWLSEESGHFTISRVVHSRVAVPPIPVAKMAVRVGSETFKIFESGTMAIKWVDGALPWVAAIGQSTRYTHMIKPPEYVDQEITGKEVELFRGRYVDHGEMLAAVPKETRLPEPRGIYSCQPYAPSAWIEGIGTIGAIFVLVNILLLFYSLMAGKATPILQETVTSAQYSQEQMTAPFKVPRDKSILRLSGSAPVNNSWLALDFALVDTDDRVISELYDESSYYHGQDSEGSWSEGSASFGSYFRVNKAGNYRLLVHGTGGSGTSGPSKNENVKLSLTADNTISWYFIIPLILAALVGLVEPMLRWSFETRRWSAVSGSGDDDSGDDD
ncbi:MAG: DUF4178 domain-containing protein [Desulfomonile tiedjei]|nr:DUF4178 domain-containing protein [Desulfomonile tiedjei]